MNRWLFLLTVFSLLGCGLMAGVFFAFSVFVMAGLDRLPRAQAVAAMQAINVTAITPLFMFVLFGTAIACVVVIFTALPDWKSPRAAWLFAGSAFYLAGAIVVTIACNVPRNDALAALPAGADAANMWDGWSAGWTAWNHVRAVSSLGAAVAFLVALLR